MGAGLVCVALRWEGLVLGPLLVFVCSSCLLVDRACEDICVKGLVWGAFAVRINGQAASGPTARGTISK